MAVNPALNVQCGVRGKCTTGNYTGSRLDVLDHHTVPFQAVYINKLIIHFPPTKCPFLSSSTSLTFLQVLCTYSQSSCILMFVCKATCGFGSKLWLLPFIKKRTFVIGKTLLWPSPCKLEISIFLLIPAHQNYRGLKLVHFIFMLQLLTIKSWTNLCSI